MEKNETGCNWQAPSKQERRCWDIKGRLPATRAVLEQLWQLLPHTQPSSSLTLALYTCLGDPEDKTLP
ncbi:hypothetical protein E2C01_005757 [Portunus trituberculatus]|uniref:Uncharacterized protein n=1 Tax=Portunus trituberculatus TaxID=210409 RepID=A0A5B7CUB6_PORTR|nr:hypothetical protein [Portunus trituberculatus]